MAFDYLFNSNLGIHCFLNFFKMIWGAYPLDLILNLSFLAEIGSAATALGETNASTPGAVRETKASTLCWETEASTMGRFWETKASAMWMDGGGETKASTHVLFVTYGKPAEVSTIATPLGYLSE